MSDSDSDTESEAFRPTRRNNALATKKREIRDSSSHSSDTSDHSGSQSDSNTSWDTASTDVDDDDDDDDKSGTSASESDGDGSPVQKLPSAKRTRRLPDSSSAESTGRRAASTSGSDVAVQRRPAARPYIYDDDSESSDSSWDPNVGPVPGHRISVRHSAGHRAGLASGSRNSTDPQPSTSAAARRNDALAAAAAAAATSAAGSSNSADAPSSEDDNTVDKCPICLHSFRDQPLGVPNACEHRYCLSCIEEWARNVQTCPIDRLPFTSIAHYEGGRLVSRIPVEARTTELMVFDDGDLTQCEVCRATNREESMLLCDGCNRGYHMDCLRPALTEIPDSAWYCDNCFDSDGFDDEHDNLAHLLNELQQIGVPPTRLRVRAASLGAVASTSALTPRITRTRQSERIRATILSRIAPSLRHATLGSRESALGMPLPEPSTRRSGHSTRTQTTTTRSNIARSALLRRKRRSSRRKTKRRTTRVVEYENGADGQKFPLTTAKKPAATKRKRKTTKRKAKKTSRRRGCSTRTGTRTLNSSSDHDATAAATAATAGTSGRSHAVVPRLHLFGDPNALDYFSDEQNDDDGHDGMSDENAGRGLGGTGDGGLLFAATFARTRIGGAASVLRRQKRVQSALRGVATGSSTMGADTLDVLSNIMDTMDRWHDMTKPTSVDKIRIDADGKLSLAPPAGRRALKKATAVDRESGVAGGPEVMAAPRYGGGGAGGGYNNRNQGGGGGRAGFRGNDSSGTTGVNGTSNSNLNSSSSSSSGGGTGMSFSIFGPRNLSAPIGGTGGGGGRGGGGGDNNGFDGPNMYNDFQQPRNNNRNDRNQPPPFRSNNNNGNNSNNFNNSANATTSSNAAATQRFLSNPNFCDSQQPFQQQHQQPNPGSGLYDDVNLPVPMQAMHAVTSLPPPMLSQPPPMQHLLPPPTQQQQQHMSAPPPPFVPVPALLPAATLMASAHYMPTTYQAAPPPLQMPPMAAMYTHTEISVQYTPHVASQPVPPPIPATASAVDESEQYDPAADADESDESDGPDTLDIPLPMNDAPAATTTSATTAPTTTAPAAADATRTGITSYGPGSSDDDDPDSSDDCPNLAVYSAESMNAARGSGDGGNVAGAPKNSEPTDDGEELERDEDLVQLDDDDDEEDDVMAEPDNPNADAEHDKSTAKKNILDLHDDSDWEELNNDRSGNASDAAEPAPVKVGDSDAVGKPNAGKPDKDEGKQRERSFTPCLDEQVPATSDGGDSIEADNRSEAQSNRVDSSDDDDDDDEDGRSGIAGMQTELISDDDAEDILNGKSPRSRQQRSQRRRRSTADGRDDKRSLDKRKTGGDDDGDKRGTVGDADRDGKKTYSGRTTRQKSKERDQSFKKLSGSNKERNYRDKKDEEAASSSRRRRSRSRTYNNKENRSRGEGGGGGSSSAHRRESSDVRRRGAGTSGDAKRKDMERYDVRNVIAERQPRKHKDKYGRDTSRPRSRSALRRGTGRASGRGAPSKSRSRSRGPSSGVVRRSHSRDRAATNSTSAARRSSPMSPRRRRRSSGHRRAPSLTPPPATAAASHRRRVSRSPVVVVRRDRSLSRSRSHHRHQHHQQQQQQQHPVNGKTSSSAVATSSHRSQPHPQHKQPRSPPLPPTNQQLQQPPPPPSSQRHRLRHSPSAARSCSPPSHSKSRKKSAKRAKPKKRKLSPADAPHHFDQPHQQPHASHRIDYSALPGGKRPTYSQDRTRSPSWDAPPATSHTRLSHRNDQTTIHTWEEHTERLSPWTRSPTPNSSPQHDSDAAAATAATIGASAWQSGPPPLPLAGTASAHTAAKQNVGENLTVILKNKDSGGTSSGKRSSKKLKKRSKDKRTKDGTGDKRERRSKRDRATDRSVVSAAASLATTGVKSAPSKEVFASGDNILVSVSFNKESAGKSGGSSGGGGGGSSSKHHHQKQTTIVTMPATKDLISGNKNAAGTRTTASLTITASGSAGSVTSAARRSRGSGGAQQQRHRKISQKPVAIIDLDRSPFQEITPSPRAVIVLDSDSDGYADDDVQEIRSLGLQTPPAATTSLGAAAAAAAAAAASKTASQQQQTAGVGLSMTSLEQLTDEQHNVEQVSQPQSPTGDSEFDLGTGGPKTPPEPNVSSSAAAASAAAAAAVAAGSSSSHPTASSSSAAAASSLVKFSLPLKNKLRAVTNPLHEPIEEDPTPSQPQQQLPLTGSMLGNSHNSTDNPAIDSNIISAAQPSPSHHATAANIEARANVVEQNSGSTTQPQQPSPLLQQSTPAATDINTTITTSTTSTTTTSTSSSTAQPTAAPPITHNKIGPNTPPESGPCSPDAYDPFEPTESATTSPQHGQPDTDGPTTTTGRHSSMANNDGDSDRFESHTPPPLLVKCVAPSSQQTHDKSLNNNTATAQQPTADKSVKPVDLAMALINSKASLDAANSFLSTSLDGGKNATSAAAVAAYDIPDGGGGGGGGGGSSSSHITTIDVADDDDDDDDDDVQIVHTTGLASSRPPAHVMRQLSQDVRAMSGTSMRQSPIKLHSGSSLISKLPLPPKPAGKSSSTSIAQRQLNGSGSGCGSIGDDPMDGMPVSAVGDRSTVVHESPYSPDSSDYDDLFEPPPISPDSQQALSRQPFGGKKAQRPKSAELLEDLFGSTSPAHQRKFGGRPSAGGNSTGKRAPATTGAIAASQRKRTKPSGGPARGPSAQALPQASTTNKQLNDEQQRLFDEIPGSAVEMHAQEQYLTKLNRLDRVVEEVKLVLKPHYTKKYITKEDYKDILRRAVPKINHNRTGEINPKKIKALVEAYVRKFRHRRKPHAQGSGGGHFNMSND